MPAGVNSFSSHRLQQARALREVESQRALANMTGLSPEIISRYERGTACPTADSLFVLSKALRMPPDYFLSDPIQGEKQSPVFFRSMVSTLDTKRDRSRAYLELLEESTIAIDSIVELPDCTIPSWNDLGKLDVLSPQLIEEAAIKTRQHLSVGSGPFPNLANLLEAAGVSLAQLFLADRELDGLSQWSDDRAYIVLNNSKSAARSRFDLAHELGHLVLHRHVEQVYMRDRESFKKMEQQAHHFAGALLLPAEEFANDVWSGTLDEFASLKGKWQVSAQAMVRRAHDLGIVTEEHYLRLQKAISYRKWRAEEPLEEVVRRERPSLLSQAVQVVLHQMRNGRERIMSLIPFGPEILSTLTGLETRVFLPEDMGVVVPLRSRAG